VGFRIARRMEFSTLAPIADRWGWLCSKRSCAGRSGAMNKGGTRTRRRRGRHQRRRKHGITDGGQRKLSAPENPVAEKLTSAKT
jgi:hypothetical protein